MIRRIRKAFALLLCDLKHPKGSAERKQSRKRIGQRFRKPRRPKKRDVYEVPRGLSDE